MNIKTEIKIPQQNFFSGNFLLRKLSYQNAGLSNNFHIIIILKKRQTWQDVSRFSSSKN